MNTETLNPITLKLIKNALESTVDEMALTIVRTAYSSNLKNSMDFSTGFCSNRGELIAQGLCLPLHLGSLPDGMRAILNKYGESIYPGDVFILNDPFDNFPNFKLVYTEQNLIINDLNNQGMNLPEFVYYQGIQGPIKIWEIEYTGKEKVDIKYLDRDSSKYLNWDL